MKAIWYSLCLFFHSVSLFVVDYDDPLKIKKRQNLAMIFLDSFPSKTFEKKKQNQKRTQPPTFSAIPDANIGL